MITSEISLKASGVFHRQKNLHNKLFVQKCGCCCCVPYCWMCWMLIKITIWWKWSLFISRLNTWINFQCWVVCYTIKLYVEQHSLPPSPHSNGWISLNSVYLVLFGLENRSKGSPHFRILEQNFSGENPLNVPGTFSKNYAESKLGPDTHLSFFFIYFFFNPKSKRLVLFLWTDVHIFVDHCKSGELIKWN